MNAGEAAEFVLRLPRATTDNPFGASPDVYRVERRIFAFIIPDSDQQTISLK